MKGSDAQEAGFLVPASELIVIPFVFVALLALVLAAVAWKRTRSQSSLVFTMAMLAISVWVGASAVETWSQMLAEKILWAKLAYLGIVWVSALWLLFTLEFIYPKMGYTRRLAPWLLVIPVLTLGLALTNEAHHLIWRDMVPATLNNELYVVYTHGAWFWFFAVFSYAVLLASAVLLVRATLHYPRIYRGQFAGLAAGMALPWIANMVYLCGWSLRPGLDLTPYGFAFTGLIFGWILYRFELFEVAPLAYEAILDNISDGYLVVDGGGRVIEASSACCRYLGLERRAILGQPVTAALSEWKPLLRLVRMSGTAQVEFVSERAPALWLEASASNWFDNGRQMGGRLLILHDITRRRQAEENLRSSEELYRLLVHTAPVGIIMTDTGGKVTFASPTVLRLYEASGPEELIGHTPRRWIHAEDQNRAMGRIRSVIDEGEILGPTEYRMLRKDGSVFWAEVISTPIAGPNGGSLGLMGIIRDVTAQRNLRTQLQRNLERETFINTLLEILYRTHDLRAALGQVLEYIGGFTGASRVYICQDSADGSETSLAYEWCGEGYPPRVRDSVLVRYTAIPSWKRMMAETGMVAASSAVELSSAIEQPSAVEQPSVVEQPVEMPVEQPLLEDIAEFLNAWNVQSLAAVPIYGSEERLFGFLAVDDCAAPRAWSSEDIDLLTVVCRIVSGTVARIQAEAAEQRQRALAEALHDTASAMNGTLNLEEVLDRVLSNLERVVQHVSVNIALVDDENCIRFVRWRGYAAEADIHFRSMQVNCNEMETYRRMTETGLPVIIEDTWNDRAWKMYEPMTWIRSYAAMPIRRKGRISGFINIDSPEPDFFTEDFSYSLGVFAEQAAVAIENARLYDTVRRRAEEMSILNRIAATLTAGLETEQVLMALFDECRQVLPLDVFSVALYDHTTGIIDIPLYYNDGSFQKVQSRDVISAPGLTGSIIARRKTLYLPDTSLPEVQSQYSIIRLGGRPARSYVGVPLILLDHVVGVISIQSYEAYAYVPEQIRLFEMIATQTAIAVQNSRLYDQMRQMAITDAVTGLFTRRHFTTLGTSEVERALRYNRQLGVLMVDLDHFKLVNDTYGHSAGDLVLQIVARVCREALRATDIVGRWGGEEFAVVLPEADRDGAALIGERIRRMMAEQDMGSDGHHIHVTVSIGVATLCPSYSTLDLLIGRADKALYLAKQNGRNRVSVSEAE